MIASRLDDLLARALRASEQWRAQQKRPRFENFSENLLGFCADGHQQSAAAREILDQLKDEFDRELDLPFRNCRAEQSPRGPACSSQGRSRSIKEVGIAVTWAWWRKISVVQNVKHFCAELDVEIFRDSSDVVVLKNGEVQIRNAWADKNVAAGIAAEIEAT